MRAPRRRHACMSPGRGSGPSSPSSPTLPRRRRRSRLAPIATMPARPTATSSPPSSNPRVSSKPLAVDSTEGVPQVPSSSFAIITRGGVVNESTNSIQDTIPQSPPRQGTKRPRDTPDPTRSSMCRRGSTDVGDGAEHAAVVALVPRAAMRPVKPKSVPGTTPIVTRTLAFAAATATATAAAQVNQLTHTMDDDRTVRARFQRLLVQFVMLPVVWVSLCCVITAAMGIEAMESLQKVLVLEADPDRPTKKPKHDFSELLRGPARRGDVASATLHNDGVVTKPKVISPQLPSTETTCRRRRRVLIWDLDETLVLFASLHSGQFARTHNKDMRMTVALGEQMMTYLLAVLERHFFFSDLHNADIDHISSVAMDGIADGSTRAIADRYAKIRAIYERRPDGRVDFLDDPTSPWFTARQALVTSIDTLSTGWIHAAQELLTLTQQSQDDEEIINIMVTNTQLSPALCKCLIYGLDTHFPIDRVYSSSKLHKLHCFQTIMTKYGSGSCDRDVEFIGIGDGPEEAHVSDVLGMSFFKIRSLEDLRKLRYELELVENPVSVAVDSPVETTPTTPPAAACTTSVQE